MNKLVEFAILCLVCSSALEAHALRITGSNFEPHVLDVSDDDMDDVVQDESKITMIENCFIKILSPSVNCILNSLVKWNVDVHSLKHAINDRPTCCATWQTTDCLINKAKVYCTPEENIEFNAHMNDLTEKRNHFNCSQIQYHSNNCHQSDEEEEPTEQVFTDVVVKEEDKDNAVNDEPIDQVVDKRVSKPEEDLHLSDLGEFKLAQRLLDRVNRITIHKVVIDLHPIRNHEVKTHETDLSSRAEFFEP